MATDEQLEQYKNGGGCVVREDKVGWVHADVKIEQDGRVGKGQGGWEDGVAPLGAADRRADINYDYEDEVAIRQLEAELRRFYSIFGIPGDAFEFIRANCAHAFTRTHGMKGLTACNQSCASMCVYFCS
jgi:hypothetical protein